MIGVDEFVVVMMFVIKVFGFEIGDVVVVIDKLFKIIMKILL